jgi:hypothetical protein
MAKREHPAKDWRRQVIDMLPRMEANMTQTAGFEPGPANSQPFSPGIHLQPSFDVVDALPAAAAERLRQLRERSSNANALIPRHEDVREASALKQDAERAYRRLVDHRSSGGYELPESDNRVVEAKKVLAKASDDFERIKQRTEAKAQAWQAISGALSNVENWLRFGLPGNCQIEPIQVEEPKLAKGENGLLDAIENRRRRVREIKASIHTIQSSCFPSSYCKERLRETVEQLAARGMPDVSGLIEHDQDINIWPMQRVQSQVIGAERSLAFHEAVDVVGLLAFLLKPAMISALDALVDAEKDDKNSLSHEARRQREAEAMGDLLDIERQEAALVFSAQAQGLPVEFRPDCDPRAILQIQLLQAPRADALPETSPGLSWPWRR